MLTKRHRKFGIAVLGCLVTLLFPSTSLSQSVDEIIRIDTDLVTVPATVMDRDGRYVADLKKTDFEIREDGIIQEIALFEAVDVPFTVLLVLDNSGSMNEQIGSVAKASNAFINELRDEDRLIIATFRDDKKIRIVCPPTRKKDFHGKIVLSPRHGDSYTTTFNAVERAINYIADFDGRKAIVLFSDGELYGLGASAKSNLRDAEEQDAVIYTVRFGEYPNSQPDFVRTVKQEDVAKYGNPLGVPKHEWERRIGKVIGYMHGLSERTGGRSYEAPVIGDLKSAFQAVANDLGRQYRLGYYPKNAGKDGEHRTIKVQVTVPNAAVRSRNEVVYRRSRS